MTQRTGILSATLFSFALFHSPDAQAELPYLTWDSFTQTARPVDVLYTVDKSGSMYDDMYGFIGDFSALTETLNDYGIDYQVATVAEDDGCISGSDLYIDDGFTASEAELATDTMVGMYGSTPSNTERGFLLLEAAYDEAQPSGCNDGFVREN